MATTQSSSTLYSPQDNREVTAKLADACVNPSYMVDLFAVFVRRIKEVLPQNGWDICQACLLF